MTRSDPPPHRPRRWLAELRGLAGLALAVLTIHSLVAKPFYIPSESMMPGLQVGDRLVVSRWPYGWSYASAAFHLLPPLPGRLFGRTPTRGDVVIVDRAGNEREDLIKRVIGLPGDLVELRGGHLWLNGRAVEARPLGERLVPIDGNFHCDPHDPDPSRAFPGYAGARLTGPDGRRWCRLPIVRETLPNGATYDTVDFGRSALDDTPPVRVPAGHLFLLGDNRDDSADSRVPTASGGLGGPVPIEAVGGRAEFTTFSLNGSAGRNPFTWAHNLRPERAWLPLRPAGPLPPHAGSR
jgi:signal peptidase I